MMWDGSSKALPGKTLEFHFDISEVLYIVCTIYFVVQLLKCMGFFGLLQAQKAIMLLKISVFSAITRNRFSDSFTSLGVAMLLFLSIRLLSDPKKAFCFWYILGKREVTQVLSSLSDGDMRIIVNGSSERCVLTAFVINNLSE